MDGRRQRCLAFWTSKQFRWIHQLFLTLDQSSKNAQALWPLLSRIVSWRNSNISWRKHDRKSRLWISKWRQRNNDAEIANLLDRFHFSQRGCRIFSFDSKIMEQPNLRAWGLSLSLRFWLKNWKKHYCLILAGWKWWIPEIQYNWKRNKIHFASRLAFKWTNRLKRSIYYEWRLGNHKSLRWSWAWLKWIWDLKNLEILKSKY